MGIRAIPCRERVRRHVPRVRDFHRSQGVLLGPQHLWPARRQLVDQRAQPLAGRDAVRCHRGALDLRREHAHVRDRRPEQSEARGVLGAEQPRSGGWQQRDVFRGPRSARQSTCRVDLYGWRVHVRPRWSGPRTRLVVWAAVLLGKQCLRSTRPRRGWTRRSRSEAGRVTGRFSEPPAVQLARALGRDGHGLHVRGRDEPERVRRWRTTTRLGPRLLRRQ